MKMMADKTDPSLTSCGRKGFSANLMGVPNYEIHFMIFFALPLVNVHTQYG